MEISSAFNTGLQGIQQSQQKIDQTASEIANASTVYTASEPRVGQPRSSDDVAEQLVELRRHELAYKASAEVIRSADQLLSKLVDEAV